LKIAFNSLSFDEDSFNAIQDRLFLINRLKKKYGKSIEAIFEQRESFIERINLIQHRQEILDELKVRIETSYKAFYEKALLLSEYRKSQARGLKTAIIKEIQELYLDKAQFEIDFKETQPTIHGIDSVEFLISMNPGESLKPLIKVASGGEVSKIMLDMKFILNQRQRIKKINFVMLIV